MLGYDYFKSEAIKWCLLRKGWSGWFAFKGLVKRGTR